MSFPPHDAKEQIRQSIEIVDLIGSYLPVQPQGRGYVALCPFHSDTRPSLQINPERQSWKCWVCGDKGGDIFSFVMEYEKVEFREALEMLAERAGIAITGYQPQTAPAGSPGDKQTLYKAAAWAEDQYHQCLLTAPEAADARAYLAQRNISSESIQRFRIGFSPLNWQWLCDRARSTPYSPEVLLAAGLIAKSDRGSLYDRLRGRVIFSIRDVQARPIAFGGRILPELAQAEQTQGGRAAAKYINSPESRLFTKSDHLYGLQLARDVMAKDRTAIVVEGYTDVVMAHQYGLQDVVAVLGTALGPRHIKLLRRFADTVVLVLDGDEAGQRRTNEVLELFVAAQVDLRILTLPAGLDPADYVSQQGAASFRELLAAAPDALDHKLKSETGGIDLVNDTHRATQALESILSTIAKAPRWPAGAQDTSRLRENQMLSRLAREFAVPDEELRTRLRDLRRYATAREQPSDPSTTSTATADPMTPREQELFEVLLHFPELVGEAIQRITIDCLSSESAQQLFSVYLELQAGGEPVDFMRVMMETESVQLKHVLVDLDERAQAKAECALEDASQRLNGLIQHFDHSLSAGDRRQKRKALKDRQFNEDEEKQVLLDLLEQERKRQGISVPTDG